VLHLLQGEGHCFGRPILSCCGHVRAVGQRFGLADEEEQHNY